MNVTDRALRDCTSCQMCAAICPKNAINIVLDKDGFYRPLVNDSLCVNCGLCKTICYKYDEHIDGTDNDRLAASTLLGAAAKDSGLLMKSSSGGIASLLATQLIHDGYKCVGVVYNADCDAAMDVVASSEDDLKKFRGSKYIQSYTLDAFKEVVANCKYEKYAVFGTPCHIYALDRYLCQHKIRDRHILVDVYCHGCPSIHIWKKYINDIKTKVGHKEIKNVNFRSKNKGWGNYCIEIEINDAPEYLSSSHGDEFFDIFFSDQVLNSACNDCALRSTLVHADIRLGDFWGKQYVLNTKGVSAVSLVSKKSKFLFQRISDKIIFNEESYNDFLPWQSWDKTHTPNQELRHKLFDELRDENISLQHSISTLRRYQSLKGKIVRIAKLFISYLPIRFEKFVRWLYYKIK